MNNKGLNNKGFTLVELLAVVVILLAISVIAVTNVSASLERNNNQELKSQEKMAISAAKIYFYDNNMMTVGSKVQIKTLYLDGYLNKSKTKKLVELQYVILCNNGYQINSGTACS